MDRKFMEAYYKSKYYDPVAEICEKEADFYRIRHRAYVGIEKLEERLRTLGQEAKGQEADKLEEWLKEVGEDLDKMLHTTLDDLAQKYTYIIEKSYLQGAYDRERMLR